MGGCSAKAAKVNPLSFLSKKKKANILTFLTVAVASSFEQKYVWKEKDVITLTDGTQLRRRR